MSTLTIQIQPTIKQDLTWQKLQDKTTTEILFGGAAGGGKSYIGCQWLLFNCITYPGSRWLLGRAVLKTLKQTTLLTLLDVAKSWGLKQSKQGLAPFTFNYNEQQGEITFWNGSVIHLKDLAYYPSDPEYDSLGSTEYTGAFIDEANQVRVKAKEIITVRLRYKLDEFGLSPKLLMSCNPAKNWVYSEFHKPAQKGTLDEWKAFIQALPTDNPHLPKATIEQMKRIKDKATKERLLHGNWEYDDDPLALFNPTAVFDLFTNLLTQETPQYYISCDAARMGRDLCVIMVWEGWKVVHITSYPISKLPTIENEIERLRQLYSIPRSHVIVDEDGVGGGVVDHLPGVKGFIANATPIQDPTKRDESTIEGIKEYKLNYDRLKTQCYYLLADKVNAGQLAIPVATPEEQEAISEELGVVKSKNVDKDTKIQILSKEEMKETLGRSPDYADTLMMRCVFELSPERQEAFVVVG
jgi:phage terminase large subunit